jgi:UDP-N-acetylmuramate dehydrogenase
LKKSEIIKKLSEAVEPSRIYTDEPMNRHTTFRVGGPADIFIEVDNEKELRAVVGILEGDFFLIGNGSNLLVSDSGIRGNVIYLSKEFNNIEVRGTSLICGAGATLAAISRCAYDNSLTGFEFAQGIPGSLGGAIVMNAGAYDGEMSQVVKSVRLMTYDGDIVTKTNDEMHFSYRHSLLKEEKYIVLEVEIALEMGDKSLIKEKLTDLGQRRRDKQPLEYPSAGSTFKRPKGYFAAKLIDEAGFKGYRVGGAIVSPKHCGFVVNDKNATAQDIYTIIKDVQSGVLKNSGVTIEPEVILVGDFIGNCLGTE